MLLKIIQCKIQRIKWVQRCKNTGLVLEHFACLVSTCTNGHLVQKSTAVVFLRGHMNSWGQNFLQQGPFHLEQAFSAMSDAVFTCQDKTNLFNTVQLFSPPPNQKYFCFQFCCQKETQPENHIEMLAHIKCTPWGCFPPRQIVCGKHFSSDRCFGTRYSCCSKLL